MEFHSNLVHISVYVKAINFTLKLSYYSHIMTCFSLLGDLVSIADDAQYQDVLWLCLVSL
jgi:hypothetical protein